MTSNFSKTCLQTDYLTYNHCITIPVGQKFTYTKLTVPLIKQYFVVLWYYVNFWPTGNIHMMKEIKAEINYSRYYYSDISDSYNKVVILTVIKQGIFTWIKCQELWETD